VRLRRFATCGLGRKPCQDGAVTASLRKSMNFVGEGYADAQAGRISLSSSGTIGTDAFIPSAAIPAIRNAAAQVRKARFQLRLIPSPTRDPRRESIC